MKRVGIFLMVWVLLFTAVSGLAEALDTDLDIGLDVEQTEPRVFDEFIIGATTRLNGAFFTNMWGNNTCDIDVRSLIHGYSPVVWTLQSRFDLNMEVVQDVQAALLTDGNKLFQVTLWGDLCYNDGTPITARDYVFSLMLFADPVINALGGITTNTSYIEGYDEYLSGKSDVFAGVRLVADYTFTIEVKAEYLPFFFEIAFLDCIPYPISVIAPGCEVADDGNGCYIRNSDASVSGPIWNAQTLQNTILDPDTGYLSHPYVTCGPYMLTSFDWDTRIAKFDLNPYYKGYYDGQKPTIDHLVFKSVLPGTMIDEYENEEVHLLNKVVAGDNILSGFGLVGEGTAVQVSYPRMGLGFISFACEQGPAQFESVRKAIAYAIDRDQFTDDYTMGFGATVDGYYGIGQWMVQMIGGTLPAEEIENDEEQEAWDALIENGLDSLTHYTLDLDKAQQILIDDGWVLNASGKDFDKAVDTVRYKRLANGSLMALSLKWGVMEDSWAASMLVDMLVKPLAGLGMELDLTVVPFVDLLQHYYRQVDRTYDMMYLATNFISIFDPYFVFNTGDEYQGPQNTTGYRDEKLEALALELRQTPSGAMLEYCQKWLKFQEYYNEVIPMLPLYSNIYFDFHVPELQDYNPNAEMNWPVAILYATLGEAVEDDVEAADGDEIIIF